MFCCAKIEERASHRWIGLVILSPFIGSVLYWLFGVNRIKTRGGTTRFGQDKRQFLPSFFALFASGRF
ncbi:MAG: PLDc N-terminal domain-containing protein [bacterium]|nr:PLDc N-terminal domain-containing protein [bacterium]